MGTKGVTAFLILSAICGICVSGHGHAGVTCVECEDADSAYDCNTDDTKTCSHDEMCYVIRSSNGKYTAGCKHVTSCHDGVYGTGLLEYNQQCCSDSNYCNTALIEKIVKPQAMPTTPTTPSVPQPAFQLTSGLECHVCSGASCGVGSKVHIKCPDDFPYCMNSIQNSANGDKIITKKCASYNDCRMSYEFIEGKHHDACAAYDPSEIYVTPFECSYCCETNLCNRNIVPYSQSLLMG